VSGTVAVLGRFARELLRLGQDRIAHGLPRRIDDVGPSHLTAWLGTEVTGVSRLDATKGTTDRARLALDGPGAPETVFLKIPASSAGIRLFGNLAGLGENEVRFYREVRPGLDIGAPALLGSSIDPATKRYALVLEDLAVTGATFADATTSLDPAQVLLVLENLARLHGRFWSSPRLDGDLGWVRANRDDPMLPAIHRALTSMAKRIARDAPELVPAGGRAILARYPAIAQRLDQGPHTILHGDPHPGNCYFVDGGAGLFDWQVLRRGHPLRDVSYHLILALDPGTRRAVERDLLESYCAALAGHGGPSLGADEAWTTYRRMAAGPYVAATFTVGLAGLQRDDIARSGLRRAVAAIEDLGTADTLDLEPIANPGARAGKIRRWGSPRTPR
jgi:hypothetical protein